MSDKTHEKFGLEILIDFEIIRLKRCRGELHPEQDRFCPVCHRQVLLSDLDDTLTFHCSGCDWKSNQLSCSVCGLQMFDDYRAGPSCTQHGPGNPAPRVPILPKYIPSPKAAKFCPICERQIYRSYPKGWSCVSCGDDPKEVWEKKAAIPVCTICKRPMYKTYGREAASGYGCIVHGPQQWAADPVSGSRWGRPGVLGFDHASEGDDITFMWDSGSKNWVDLDHRQKAAGTLDAAYSAGKTVQEKFVGGVMKKYDVKRLTAELRELGAKLRQLKTRTKKGRSTIDKWMLFEHRRLAYERSLIDCGTIEGRGLRAVQEYFDDERMRHGAFTIYLPKEIREDYMEALRECGKMATRFTNLCIARAHLSGKRHIVKRKCCPYMYVDFNEDAGPRFKRFCLKPLDKVGLYFELEEETHAKIAMDTLEEFELEDEIVFVPMTSVQLTC